MNRPNKILTVVVAALAAVAAQAADDAVKVTTLRQVAGSTVCNNDSFGYPLSEPAVIVRGNAHHKIRIERNLVDVGLESATFSSCGPDCVATLTNKGNFDSGGRGNLIDRKGFAEFDVHLPVSTPTGNATLVLNYVGGGRGEYKLLVVRNSRVDRVESVNVSSTTDRVTLHGNNLDRISNRFNGFTRVSEADAALVLAPEHRSCSVHTETIDLTLEASRFCHIKDVKIPLSRDASCPAAGNAPPAAPPPVRPPTAGSSGPALNLTPVLLSTALFFRSNSPTSGEATALRRQVNSAFCAGMARDEEKLVTLRPIQWGIAYAGLPANGAVSADILDGSQNLLQRRTADPITQGNGTDIRTFDNWTGRATAARVIFAFAAAKIAALGTGPAAAGCYLAATEPLAKLDPAVVTVRVNTGNPPLAESNSSDNSQNF